MIDNTGFSSYRTWGRAFRPFFRALLILVVFAGLLGFSPRGGVWAFGKESEFADPENPAFSRNILRLGLFPGSFDPVHRGHLEVARMACDHLRLDAVLFIPNLVNPRKPGLSSLEFRHDLLERGIREFGDRRFAILSLAAIATATAGDPSVTPAQRLLNSAMALAPQARIYQILGSDSLPKVIQNNGMPRQGDRLKIAVVERSGDRSLETLDGTMLRNWMQGGILTRLRSDVGDLSSTEIRVAFSDGLPPVVKEKLPSGLYRRLILEGAYGLASHPAWPELLMDTADSHPSPARSEKKREILLSPVVFSPFSRELPTDLKTNGYQKFDSQRLTGHCPSKRLAQAGSRTSHGLGIHVVRNPPSEMVRQISFASLHTLGDIRKYLEDRLPSTALKLLCSPGVAVDLFAGNREQVVDYLATFASQAVELVLKREYVTTGFFLARCHDGSFRLLLGGDIYGETRLLHSEAMLAAALSTAGRNPQDYSVIRPSGQESQFFISQRRFREILGDVIPGTVDAVIIGYAKGISDDLANRYDLWKSFPHPLVFQDGRLSYDWVKSRKRKFGGGWIPDRYPEKFNPDPELPHNQYLFRTGAGTPLRLLVTRNVYGDQTTALVDVLVKEKKIRRIFLFGNAGSLDSKLNIGTIMNPVQVASIPGQWLDFHGNLVRPIKPWMKSTIREARVFSVFSPIQETVPLIRELTMTGAGVVDVEMAHLLETLERLQGFDVRASALLIISDQPGKSHTLSELFRTEALLGKSRALALDAIYNELDITGPL